jgi:3-hydroxybutyryl-CoA dehydrogenase
MSKKIETEKITVGIVGLGLMGCSITTCLLIANHTVIAVAPISVDMSTAAARIRHHLTKSKDEGIISLTPNQYFEHLTITEDFTKLAKCSLVIECTLEDMNIKKLMYAKVEAVISPEALLTSNTSAIPISSLQDQVKYPDRFFGLHWAEPSHTTRFLEIICGTKSEVTKGEYLYELAHFWGKEPTLVRKDIRGFITNRLMYAMYREACYLVENGYATVEDVDRACRNNPGYWMTLVGVFRWMDLTGVPAYHTVMKDLLPDLCISSEIPTLIDDIVKAEGKGVSNGRGFYSYTPEEAQLWEETFRNFSYEIRKLALKYPADIVSNKLKK